MKHSIFFFLALFNSKTDCQRKTSRFCKDLFLYLGNMFKNIPHAETKKERNFKNETEIRY